MILRERIGAIAYVGLSDHPEEAGFSQFSGNDFIPGIEMTILH